MTKDEMDAIMKDLEEPVSVLNKNDRRQRGGRCHQDQDNRQGDETDGAGHEGRDKESGYGRFLG